VANSSNQRNLFLIFFKMAVKTLKPFRWLTRLFNGFYFSSVKILDSSWKSKIKYWNTLQFAMQEWPGHTCYCWSTFNNSLGVLSGVPPLRHRLFYLNFRYLVNTFQKNGHPLREKLEKLNGLSPQECLIPFHEVSGLDIQSEVGYTRHELGAILSTPKV
jgi:hypothetical protein